MLYSGNRNGAPPPFQRAQKIKRHPSRTYETRTSPFSRFQPPIYHTFVAMRRRRAPSRRRPEVWYIRWALNVICLRGGRAQPRLAEVDIEIVILPLLSLSGTIVLHGAATRSADDPTSAMLVVDVRVRVCWHTAHHVLCGARHRPDLDRGSHRLHQRGVCCCCCNEPPHSRISLASSALATSAQLLPRRLPCAQQVEGDPAGAATAETTGQGHATPAMA